MRRPFPQSTPARNLQLLVLAAQARRLDGAVDDEQQAIGLERLLDEVVGALADRRHRDLDRAVPADHDHGDRRVLGADRVKHTHAVDAAAFEPDVEQNQGRPPCPERCQRRIRIRGHSRVVAFVGERIGNDRADICFVVDDQNLLRHTFPTAFQPPLFGRAVPASYSAAWPRAIEVSSAIGHVRTARAPPSGRLSIRSSPP